MGLIKRLYPALSRVRPYLHKTNEFKNGASRSWTVSPAEQTQVPPAIFDPADIDRITGVTADDTIDEQIQRTQACTAHHGATVAYELRDAVIASGHVFTNKVYYRLGYQPAPLIARSNIPHLSDGVLATTPYGIRYFGHWMGDDLPLHLAARDLGRPLSVLSEPTAQQRAFLRILNINAEEVQNAHVDRLVIVEDSGQNSYKRERLARLRACAKPYGRVKPAAGVMLLRGQAGANRNLINETEIADLVSHRGLIVLDPARTDAEELLRACTGVRIVLGVEGSQLTNGLLWMDARGALVALQPPQRFCMVLKDWCDAIGTRYAFIVGHQRGQDDFYIEPDAVRRLLERLEA
jgi:capsular polysaccharide biosynthesis protein